MKKLFKHPLFIGGFLFLLLLVLASLFHSIFFNDTIPVTKYLYDDDGFIIEKAPFSPLQVPPLGTSWEGRHIFYMLLQGAKFTIGIAIAVAVFRLIISFFVGLCFGDYLSRFNKFITGFVNAFYYLPISLICYVLLHEVLIFGPFDEVSYSFFQRAVFELMLLTAIAIPTTSLLIGNQINHVYKEEFITAAKLLGGSRFHILKKHVLPHMWPRLVIQFVREVVQVLTLLIHLGFFRLLFGGSLKMYPDKSIFISLSSEWSGMVGNGFSYMEYYPWNFLGPMVAFTAAILACNFMVKGVEDVFFGTHHFPRKTRKINTEKKQQPEDMHFEFINKETM